MITKNQAMCNNCGQVISSEHQHDFVTCSCGKLSVDGGLHSIRRCFEDRDEWSEMSEFGDEEGE